jgi:hypothetical protein
MGYQILADLENSFPLETIDLVAVEVPQIYGPRQQKRPNDLIKVALLVGALGGLLPESLPIKEYRPSNWKGQVPKKIMVERIKAKLSAEERGRVLLPSAKSEEHNVYDAVGIGLHFCKRR